MPRAWIRLPCVALAVAAGVAAAVPSPGAPLPRFQAPDLRGVPHDSAELLGKPTLIVAISDRSSAAQMAAWFREAKWRISPGLNRVSVVALRDPFFIPIQVLRWRARRALPSAYWADVLLEKDGNAARALGLPQGPGVTAIALDPSGRVVAVASGGPDTPQAQRVWNALRRPAERPRTTTVQRGAAAPPDLSAAQ